MRASLLTCLVIAFSLAGCAGAQVVPDAQVVPGDRPGPSVANDSAAQAADAALAQVGRPYRYGGDTPAGFDCSGLVRYSYLQVGVPVSRETRTLRGQAHLIRAADLRRGDLVFFDQEGKKYSHVGIYVGDGHFVHAPSSGGRVRTDRLDSHYWKRHFVEARRI